MCVDSASWPVGEVFYALKVLSSLLVNSMNYTGDSFLTPIWKPHFVTCQCIRTKKKKILNEIQEMDIKLEIRYQF